MHAMRDERTRKAVLIGIFFTGSVAALIWLLREVGTWVFAVLKATGH